MEFYQSFAFLIIIFCTKETKVVQVSKMISDATITQLHKKNGQSSTSIQDEYQQEQEYPLDLSMKSHISEDEPTISIENSFLKKEKPSSQIKKANFKRPTDTNYVLMNKSNSGIKDKFYINFNKNIAKTRKTKKSNSNFECTEHKNIKYSEEAKLLMDKIYDMYFVKFYSNFFIIINKCTGSNLMLSSVKIKNQRFFDVMFKFYNFLSCDFISITSDDIIVTGEIYSLPFNDQIKMIIKLFYNVITQLEENSIKFYHNINNITCITVNSKTKHLPCLTKIKLIEKIILNLKNDIFYKEILYELANISTSEKIIKSKSYLFTLLILNAKKTISEISDGLIVYNNEIITVKNNRFIFTEKIHCYSFLMMFMIHQYSKNVELPYKKITLNYFYCFIEYFTVLFPNINSDLKNKYLNLSQWIQMQKRDIKESLLINNNQEKRFSTQINNFLTKKLDDCIKNL